MKVFITGGSGTLGKELVKQLNCMQDVEKIVIYSRDEGKHAALKNEYPEGPPSKMRYRIGDIRDESRLKESMRDCDTVIHAAAMKRIDDCANHVQECVKTNVLGTINVINACEHVGIKTALFISTDKACSPISAYGASKYMAEHIWIHANTHLNCNYSICRYGNVIGSRGSVFGYWAALKDSTENTQDTAEIPVTDLNATRFFWPINKAAEFALQCVAKMQHSRKNATPGGFIYVPKMVSFKMLDIANNYGKPVETGFRTAEKIHECMISADESEWARDIGDCYVIYPVYHQWSTGMDIKGERISEISSKNSIGGKKWEMEM